ncbi:T9SS type A sorting domain-containing protein [Agriterribacter sp.]|uniref:T9SS type A sorting domain-containing protein n=1 Tax=Agriterribacter sp. TaxID=2821509 RepID=UPI002D1B530E|nr:T9SS type A sorting domain-containing protein [Agriterribacter sp.]HRO47778.1 T9SS type A sorting domain-containing protein [Agriterribacter sp.]HRQ17989.1 T9SS type A sorting domain-containing protein [Agriterribacter sp.]
MKTFTLIFLMGVMLHFSGFSQENYLFAAKEPAVKILKFYPNPATTIINFDFQKDYDRSYNLVIYNFLGKKVFELTGISLTNQVNLSDFTRGVYIFQLRNKNGKIIESGKFQVSK